MTVVHCLCALLWMLATFTAMEKYYTFWEDKALTVAASLVFAVFLMLSCFSMPRFVHIIAGIVATLVSISFGFAFTQLLFVYFSIPPALAKVLPLVGHVLIAIGQFMSEENSRFRPIYSIPPRHQQRPQFSSSPQPQYYPSQQSPQPQYYPSEQSPQPQYYPSEQSPQPQYYSPSNQQQYNQ